MRPTADSHIAWVSRFTEGATVKMLTINRDRVDVIRKQLEDRLNNATDEDWRFILEMLNTRVYAFGDGTWEVEVSVPAVQAKISRSGSINLPCRPYHHA